MSVLCNDTAVYCCSRVCIVALELHKLATCSNLKKECKQVKSILKNNG